MIEVETLVLFNLAVLGMVWGGGECGREEIGLELGRVVVGTCWDGSGSGGMYSGVSIWSELFKYVDLLIGGDGEDDGGGGWEGEGEGGVL